MVHLNPESRIRSASSAMEPMQVHNPRHGQIGGNQVEVGDGARAQHRSPAGRALDAFVGFFKALGSAIADVFTSLKNMFSAPANQQAAINPNGDIQALPSGQPRTLEQNKALLSNLLPPGITISDAGVIGGVITTDCFGKSDSLGKNSEKSFVDVLTGQVETELVPKGTKEKPTENPVVCDIMIGHQASVDFYRLDFTFGSGEGAFKTRSDTEKNTSLRTEHAVLALREFTGSDIATTTLSAVLTQNLSRFFTDSCKDDNGDRMGFQIEQGKAGAKPFRETDGADTMATGNGIGKMPISLTRDENGDYKLNASWDMFVGASRTGTTNIEFPGMGGSMIKCTSEMEFTIDAKAADLGQLVIRTNGDPVSISFSGRMAPAD